jgi:hypothetical protein
VSAIAKTVVQAIRLSERHAAWARGLRDAARRHRWTRAASKWIDQAQRAESQSRHFARVAARLQRERGPA